MSAFDPNNFLKNLLGSKNSHCDCLYPGFYPSHVSSAWTNNLIIFNLNINSIPQYSSRLIKKIILNYFDVLTFCETKLTIIILQNGLLQLTNNFFRQSGNVAILLKNFSGKIRQDLPVTGNLVSV